MSEEVDIIDQVVSQEYKYGFTTSIEMEMAPKGVNEDIVRFISAKKNEPEWMLEYRLKAFRHWLKLEEPSWQNFKYPKIKMEVADDIMKKPESNQSDREKDVANTLATLRIENLRPSDSLALGLQDYIDGKKTTTDLLEEVKAKYVALRR